MPEIDELINTAIFSDDIKASEMARSNIRKIASESGIYLSSLHNLYMAFGRGKVSGFTIPALNIRTLTYDTARIVFRLARTNEVGAFIFEIAKSEMKYTHQRPDEYAISILAAAVKEQYVGPVYIQGDHFQLDKERFDADSKSAIDEIKKLISESIKAGFYNIDIDASTLVELSNSKLSEQQADNSRVSAELTNFIREVEPRNITVSVGGEIGHIGGKNSNIEDFEAFMQGYLPLIGSRPGISKVSVQTGTSHGGIVMEDGTLKDIPLDFSVLSKIGSLARMKYGLGGAVQHGASTLPNFVFKEFVKNQTLEIHLATGFQNIVFENLDLTVLKEIKEWIRTNCDTERTAKMSDEQFYYKLRKKALGPFKEMLWMMTDRQKKPILDSLSTQILFLFEALQVSNTTGFTKAYA